MLGWVVLFFVTGMVLLLVEFFLPGMVLGTAGVLLIIISAVLGVREYPDQAFWIIGGELAGAALSVVAGLLVLTRTNLLRGRLTLATSQQAAEGYVSAESDMSLVGREGVVITALRPAGTIRVGDQRLDAVSEGVFVEENCRVRVREVRGSRIVVEPLE